jgi:hypothetical protein
MDLKELEEEAVRLVNGSINSASPHRLIALHKALISDKPESWYCSTCPGKLKMTYYDLKLKYYQKSKTMSTKHKYRLPEGKTLRPFGSAVVYTNDNLTDAVAEKLIGQNKAYKNAFIVSEAKSEPKTETKSTAKTTTTATKPADTTSTSK